MKKIDKQLNKALKVLGLTLVQMIAIRDAGMQRDYFAIGGEYLVIPLILIINYLYKEAKEYIRLHR